MRSHMRELLRRQGERRGVKPSRYVYQAWDAIQRRRLGPGLRARNVGRGTRPKRRWLYG